jgi:hypothetical protein
MKKLGVLLFVAVALTFLLTGLYTGYAYSPLPPPEDEEWDVFGIPIVTRPLPTRLAPTVTPVPTSVPTPMPTQDISLPIFVSPLQVAKQRMEKSAKEIGAGLELRTSGSYACVQWLDGLGNWHDVEGWCGQIEKEPVTWYVAPRDMGTGPFRWLVDGRASEPFMLPSQHGERVVVSVSP